MWLRFRAQTSESPVARLSTDRRTGLPSTRRAVGRLQEPCPVCTARRSGRCSWGSSRCQYVRWPRSRSRSAWRCPGAAGTRRSPRRSGRRRRVRRSRSSPTTPTPPTLPPEAEGTSATVGEGVRAVLRRRRELRDGIRRHRSIATPAVQQAVAACSSLSRSHRSRLSRRRVTPKVATGRSVIQCVVGPSTTRVALCFDSTCRMLSQDCVSSPGAATRAQASPRGRSIDDASTRSATGHWTVTAIGRSRHESRPTSMCPRNRVRSTVMPAHQSQHERTPLHGRRWQAPADGFNSA